ncbi:hypothetical protein FACS1894218_6780 [Bacilli bacterium]|nr:hypothetical protein FACS1894218_6780 [Bacilli bacterium]
MLVTNKIVVMDDCFKYITADNLRYVKEFVLPYIKKHNFLILVA